MPKFNVGDYIRANDRSNGRYPITCAVNGFTGFVTKSSDREIVVIGTMNSGSGLRGPYFVDPDCFDLIEPASKSGVFKYKIGDGLVLSSRGLECMGGMDVQSDDCFIVEKRHKDGTITCTNVRTRRTCLVHYTWLEPEKPPEVPDDDILRFLFT